MKKQRHGMHGASIKSERLQAVLEVLQSSPIRGITGLHLEQEAEVRAGGTCVSELRRLGYDIEAKYDGAGLRPGSRVYRYTLRGKP